METEGLELRAIRDITKTKEQEEKLRKYSILEAKSKEMEQFTYIASHDLRHPLQTILSYIKVFDKDYAKKLDEDGQMCLHLISEAATRMDKLVLGLLDYSRLSKIKQLETVNCNDIIHAVLDDLNLAIQATDATITVNNMPTLSAYPLELRQLFQNLISNALKFKRNNIRPEINISANLSLFSITKLSASVGCNFLTARKTDVLSPTAGSSCATLSTITPIKKDFDEF